MPGGEKMTFFINRDCTFESRFADGSIVKGIYKRKASQTACFLPTRPAPRPGTKPVRRSYPVGFLLLGESERWLVFFGKR
jgi:hypothetical protein